MKKLLINIKQLVQVRPKNIKNVAGCAMKDLPVIDDAYLLIEDGKIADFGQMSQLKDTDVYDVVDCTNKRVLPSWCDSHTH